MYTSVVAAPSNDVELPPDPRPSPWRGSTLLPDPVVVAQRGTYLVDDFYRCNKDFVNLCDELGLDVSRMIGGGSDEVLLADQREMCRRLVGAGHSLTLAGEVMGRQRGFAVRAVENPVEWEARSDRCSRCGVSCVGRWCGPGRCAQEGHGRWSWSR